MKAGHCFDPVREIQVAMVILYPARACFGGSGVAIEGLQLTMSKLIKVRVQVDRKVEDQDRSRSAMKSIGGDSHIVARAPVLGEKERTSVPGHGGCERVEYQKERNETQPKKRERFSGVVADRKVK